LLYGIVAEGSHHDPEAGAEMTHEEKGEDEDRQSFNAWTYLEPTIEKLNDAVLVLKQFTKSE
jgi:hypothetical protein